MWLGGDGTTIPCRVGAHQQSGPSQRMFKIGQLGAFGTCAAAKCLASGPPRNSGTHLAGHRPTCRPDQVSPSAEFSEKAECYLMQRFSSRRHVWEHFNHVDFLFKERVPPWGQKDYLLVTGDRILQLVVELCICRCILCQPTKLTSKRDRGIQYRELRLKHFVPWGSDSSIFL